MTWVRIKLCRGHDLDVVDLAWSPDDYYLVSCSLDSNTPIIVWNMNELHTSNHKNSSTSSSSSSHNSSMICHPYKIIGRNIHTSTVKGIAFDPAGSYLASSGDDPAICIWRAHDDWGLITRIDHQSGIFRTWKQPSPNDGSAPQNNNNDDDIQALSSQSLFRRISWSTDGAFLCSTNSVVKNKHVASTISREKWQVSGGGGASNHNNNHTSAHTGTAANLVGHKQPIVVSRHASYLLHAKKTKPDNDDDNGTVPEYATLLALGDRRGFVTVWSTRKSRPIFKVQCSESHCTVTDLAWGRHSSSNSHHQDMVLLVTLLDGQVVAFKFAVPDELGYVLSSKEKARVFQLRYGIDIDDDNGESVVGGFSSGRRRQMLDTSGPNLIENALQMSLEENMKKPAEDNTDDFGMNDDNDDDDDNIAPPITQQQESRTVSGKKRIRPVLVQMSTGSGPPTKKQQKTSHSPPPSNSTHSNMDPLQSAMIAAERVSAAAERSHHNTIRGTNATNHVVTTTPVTTINGGGHMMTQERERSTTTITKQNHQFRPNTFPQSNAALSYSTSRLHSMDLPLLVVQDPFLSKSTATTVTAECVNATKIPLGSKGGSIPCIDVSIVSKGSVLWKDQIMGTFCSALAASNQIFAVGTIDGTIQMYSTSPTTGWSCGNAFRSHPPLILGTSIVSIQLLDQKQKPDSIAPTETIEMLIVTADGGFGVWTVVPNLLLKFKGTILPILTHMSYATEDRLFPKLARMQITDTGRLVAILSLDCSSTENQDTSSINDPISSNSSSHNIAGSGGSLQAFVYDSNSELWIRVSDSRFVLSDFYTALPSTKSTDVLGVLSKLDDAVRMGSLQSSLKAGQRSRIVDRYVNGIYEHSEDETCNFMASRSHCEDRLACSLAMNSPSEFKLWLKNYVRILVIKGQSTALRILVDILLQQKEGQFVTETSIHKNTCWWLSYATKILTEDRFLLVKNLVIPEMSKSRQMQRLTNEISLEVDTIGQTVTMK